MVERCEHHVVSDLAIVAQRYAAVILEMAAGVDEHSLADPDLLAETGIERRKDAQRRIDLASE